MGLFKMWSVRDLPRAFVDRASCGFTAHDSSHCENSSLLSRLLVLIPLF